MIETTRYFAVRTTVKARASVPRLVFDDLDVETTFAGGRGRGACGSAARGYAVQ